MRLLARHCKQQGCYFTRPGWVQTSQHGLDFGFDITRVMFSSGNVTERQRMGSIGSSPGTGGTTNAGAKDLEEVCVGESVP